MKKASRAKRSTIFKRAEAYVKEYRAGEADLVRLKREAKLKGGFYVEPEAKLIFVVRLRGINQVHPKTKKILQLLRLRQINNGVFVRANKATMNMLRRVEPYVMYGFPNLKTARTPPPRPLRSRAPCFSPAVLLRTRGAQACFIFFGGSPTSARAPAAPTDSQQKSPTDSQVKELVYKRGYGKVNKQRIPLTDNSVIEGVLGKHGIICIEDLVHEIVTVGPHFKARRSGDPPPCLGCAAPRACRPPAAPGPPPSPAPPPRRCAGGEQLPVALQAVLPAGRPEEEAQPLHRGWRRRQPRGEDQRARPPDELVAAPKPVQLGRSLARVVNFLFVQKLHRKRHSRT